MGLSRALACPLPLNSINIYHLTPEERQQMGVTELPGSLAEALREFNQDEVLRDALGDAISDAFERAKWSEVEESRMKVTDWELERYLEVA